MLLHHHNRQNEKQLNAISGMSVLLTICVWVMQCSGLVASIIMAGPDWWLHFTQALEAAQKALPYKTRDLLQR